MQNMVLIVEDSRNISNFEQKRVQEVLHLQTLVAATMEEALAHIKEHKEHILVALLDLCLPDAPDGEVVEAVMQEEIPVIVFTAEMSDDVRERMLESGVLDYVLKAKPAHFDYALKIIDILRNNRNDQVLVVDDSSVSRTIIRKILQKFHFEVLEAADGEEALVVFKQHEKTIKMVITDENMPKMRGVELVERLRIRRFSDTLSILGISAYGNSQLTTEFLKRGANDFLLKPFTPEEFICRILQNFEMLNRIAEQKRQAITDFLTGLHNRRYFYSIGETMLANAKRENITITAAILDIDFFKKINDTYGHDVGDHALVHISKMIRKSFRSTDIVARLGGEEFGMLCVNMSIRHALEVFEKLRAKIEQTPLIIEAETIPITVSIGVECTRLDSFDAMMKGADEQLYAAKTNGRNRVEALY